MGTKYLLLHFVQGKLSNDYVMCALDCHKYPVTLSAWIYLSWCIERGDTYDAGFYSIMQGDKTTHNGQPIGLASEYPGHIRSVT